MTTFVRPQEVQIPQMISRELEVANATDAYTFESVDPMGSTGIVRPFLMVDPRALLQQSQMLSQLLNSKFPTANIAWLYFMQYGCYCHQQATKLATSKFGYHGPALDELDELCRKSYRAQKCLENESEGEFDTSDSTSTKYPWYLNSTTNEIVCNNEKFPNWADKQSNQFRVKNCEIEKEFVLEVIDLIENQGYEKNSAFHKMRNKKYRKVCRSDEFVRTGILNLNDECCGVGLSRKPYDTVSSQCCDDKIVSLGSC